MHLSGTEALLCVFPEHSTLGRRNQGDVRDPEGLDNELLVKMVTKCDLSSLGPKGWMDVTPIEDWGVGVVRGSVIA